MPFPVIDPPPTRPTASMTGLGEVLRETMARHAHAVAVEGDNWVLSYRDLDRESARIATQLRAHGVGPGHRVPMLMARSPVFVVAMVGIVRCGAAYVPIDLANPPGRRALILRELDAPVLLADAAAMAGAPAEPGRRWLDPLKLLSQPGVAADPHWDGGGPDSPLYAMYTSGSTGTPKGVLVPQRGALRLVVGADYAEFRADARWAQLSSLAFDASTLELWGPLLNGANCVIQEAPTPSLHALGRFLRERAITDAWLTAALFNALVDEHVQALSGLRQLLTGGERASPAHMQRFLQACPQVRLINGYGPTENTTFSTCHTVTADDLHGPAGVPIGRAIRGSTAHVVGGDGRAVPDGEPGELWVGGDGVALGYLNDAERTRQKFVLFEGQRCYRTGDQVRRRPDGVLEFLGRADRQVKVQGNRIELDEVERVLARAPGVGEVAVTVRGESAESRHLVAAYGGKPVPPPAAAVRQWAESHLPPVMVPHVLHAIARMPLNLSGKLDRKALETLIDTGIAAAVPAPLALTSATERQLAALWQRHLGAVELGRDSNFLRSGGTSLLALRVADDVRRSFAREFTPIDLMRHPQLAAQAQLIDARPPARVDLAPLDGEYAVPLTRAQHAVIAASMLDPTGCAYLVHVAWRLRRAPSTAAVRAAFLSVCRRHPILRTTVVRLGDQLRTELQAQPPEGWWVEHGELARPCPPDGPWPPAVLDSVRRPPDIAAGPFRVDVWQLAPGELLLVWTVHHFAIDEASIAHIRGELSQILAGQTPDPVYGSPFAFAALEQAWTDELAVRKQADQIVRTLAGHAPPLATPPGPGGETTVALHAAVMEALARLPGQWGCTLFTPLLVAWGLTLQALFGPAWRFVLTPFSRRSEPELIEPAGCLLDMRLIEAGARPGEPLRETVERVHAAVLAAQQPRMVPLDRVTEVVTALAPEVRHGLTQFGLTWRLNAHGEFALGPCEAAQLWLPQGAARFALCLHVEQNGALSMRLEAVAQAFESGLIPSLVDTLVAQLNALCALQGEARPALGSPASVDSTPAPEPDPADASTAVAARLWTQRLGVAPPDGRADFLRDGGTSLMAMRLAAGLRLELGVSLDVAAFLLRPTFGALCAQLRAPQQTAAPTWTLVGPRSFRRVILVIPGYRGSALGMYPFADELHRRLPADHAVAIVDLRAVMARAPEHDRAWFFVRQLQQVVRDLGEARLAGVVGFSIGGLLGAELLSSLPTETCERVPLWMVDTYVPQAMNAGALSSALRATVALLRAPVATVQGYARRERRLALLRTAEQDAVAGDEVPRWQAFLAELAARRVDAPAVRAVLIHSLVAARRAGLLRRPGSNGWAPRQFKSLAVVALDVEHEALRKESAGAVAAAIAQGARPAPGDGD